MPASGSVDQVDVPPAVHNVAAGRQVQPVWQNEAGGLTFKVTGDAGSVFVKWQPAGPSVDLAAEAERLAWAGVFTPLPRVVGSGEDGDGTWLVTTEVLGQSAVTGRWRAEPATAVRAIGEGLRAFHNSVPVERCPFGWSAEERVADAQRRAAVGLTTPEHWHPDHRGLTLHQALDLLMEAPPVDELVVCHGDACAPNTIVSDDGHWAGHVDLGAMGRADRWADLAIATWSTEWNYGPGWASQLLAAYGVDDDNARTRYYRLLWDLGP
jgi:kanamycin kinase